MKRSLPKRSWFEQPDNREEAMSSSVGSLRQSGERLFDERSRNSQKKIALLWVRGISAHVQDWTSGGRGHGRLCSIKPTAFPLQIFMLWAPPLPGLTGAQGRLWVSTGPNGDIAVLLAQMVVICMQMRNKLNLVSPLTSCPIKERSHSSQRAAATLLICHHRLITTSTLITICF